MLLLFQFYLNCKDLSKGMRNSEVSIHLRKSYQNLHAFTWSNVNETTENSLKIKHKNMKLYKNSSGLMINWTDTRQSYHMVTLFKLKKVPQSQLPKTSFVKLTKIMLFVKKRRIIKQFMVNIKNKEHINHRLPVKPKSDSNASLITNRLARISRGNLRQLYTISELFKSHTASLTNENIGITNTQYYILEEVHLRFQVGPTQNRNLEMNVCKCLFSFTLQTYDYILFLHTVISDVILS